MKKHVETEIKAGIFVSIGVGLAMVSVLALSGPRNFFTRNYDYTVHFSRVDGLMTGSKVILNGVPVGTVNSIHFDKKNRNIEVLFSIASHSTDLIRKDSTVEIATQGVLGDKYLSINVGSNDEPILAPNSDIPIRQSSDITQFLSQTDHLLISLNEISSAINRLLRAFEADNRSEVFFKGIASTAKNFSQASEKLNQELNQIQIKTSINNLNHILAKIDNGTGTIGALINDPTLYDDIKALFGGINRNRIIRNLVRQTIKNSKEKIDTPHENPDSNL